MEFFKNIKNSIYNPDYYSGVISKPFSYSLKYYFLFVLLIAFVSMILLSFTVVPKIKFLTDIFSEKILQYYPDELEIVIKDGKASTNVQEPYFIKAPPGWEKETAVPDKKILGIENLLVIDTKTPFSIERFKDYKAFCYLAEESLTCYDEDQALKTTLLSKVPNVTINENFISSFIGKIEPFFKLVYPLLAIAVWFGISVVLFLRLSYLLLAAFLIWGVAKIKKVEIGYKKSYQFSMHLMTLPIIITCLINYFLSFVKINLSFPFFFTILLVIMAAINLKPKAITGSPSLPADITP